MQDMSATSSYQFPAANFHSRFISLTGHPPYPWQTQLFLDLLAGQNIWGISISAPTGSGKTAVMAVWLLALITQIEKTKDISIPRRLVWVVNRRVVVDQATEDAQRYRQIIESLPDLSSPLRQLANIDANDAPLAVSTLRGERADNRDWSRDPARAAIIIGTVDMIGSRLLFRGYGNGDATRPQHAALLAHDSLIVNDEAHLSPAFAQLLEQIPDWQNSGIAPPLRVLKLSATGQDATKYPKTFAADLENEVFAKAFQAPKTLRLIEEEKPKQKKRLIDLAITCPVPRTIVFLATPKEVFDFAGQLANAKVPAERLVLITGTQRGLERDQLVNEAKFQLFQQRVTPRCEPHFLIATSAAEVGINISCERLITTLDTIDHLLQRFGRLNRFGESTEAEAIVVFHRLKDKDEDLGASLEFLKTLPDVSPQTLFTAQNIPYPAPPRTARLQDWLLDRWALTSLTEGQLPVDDYLHGQQDNRVPYFAFLWREEVPYLTSANLRAKELKLVTSVHRPLAHEKVDVPIHSALQHLHFLAEMHPDELVLQQEANDTIRIRPLKDFANKNIRDNLSPCTFWLAAHLCYLRHGMLSESPPDRLTSGDVADNPSYTARARFFYRESEEGISFRRLGTGESIALEESQSWRDYLANLGLRPTYEVDISDLQLPDNAATLIFAKERKQQYQREVLLTEHIQEVTARARRLVQALRLRERGHQAEAEAIIRAAQLHDNGKRACIFQRSLGADCQNEESYLAKSARKGKLNLGGYRHELGSLVLQEASEIDELTAHLIAAHHGHGRPNFEPGAAHPELLPESNRQIDIQPLRFARLQRKYGYWGLAYLESILRAADWMVSEEEQAEHV
jgi:CRISPR-associated endonuclease/helicase Cas3